MKHRMLGTLTWSKDLEWHVSLFDGKIKNSYKVQDEAVKFIEDELIRVMDDYEFEVCYRIENEVLARRSYVLLKRDKNKKIIHTSLSRYEYAKTHFFYYSKDKRRKIFDYKNPDFNQLTRHCVSTRHRVTTSFLTIMGITVAFLATLLALFLTVLDNHMVKSIEATSSANGTYHLPMAIMLASGLITSVLLFMLYIFRYLKYTKLVKSNSVWHESYSNVDWRKYYKFIRKTTVVAAILSTLFAGSILTFGILFTNSALFDSMTFVPQVRIIMVIFVFTSLSVTAFGYITTYYIIRFRVSLKSIAPAILTDEGLKNYWAWLKGNDKKLSSEKSSFRQVDDHMLYPNSEVINSNPKFADMTDSQIQQFRKDVDAYMKLIIRDKFSKHGANKDELDFARERYKVW